MCSTSRREKKAEEPQRQQTSLPWPLLNLEPLRVFAIVRPQARSCARMLSWNLRISAMIICGTGEQVPLKAVLGPPSSLLLQVDQAHVQRDFPRIILLYVYIDRLVRGSAVGTKEL